MLTLFKYGLVGVLNTAVCAGVMWAGAKAGLPYAVYSVAGYLIAIANSYTCNALFTFSKPLSGACLRLFLVLNGALLLLTQVLQAGLIEGLNAPELWGVALAMVFYNVAGFFVNKHIVYGGKKLRDGPPVWLPHSRDD